MRATRLSKHMNIIFFIDFFRGEEVTKIRLGGLDHVMSFVAHDEKIFLRIYRYVVCTYIHT